MNKILVCSYRDIAHLVPLARKDGINTAKIHSNAVYFSASTMIGEVIGYAKIVRLSPVRARLSNCFVIPSERGKGFGAAMIDARIDYCKQNGYRVIDCYAYNPKRYIELGFRTIKNYHSSYGDTYYMRSTL